MGHNMDQKQAPILEGIRAYHEIKMTPFTVPGHKMGRGVDPDVRKVLGTAPFANDIPILIGVDDRKERRQALDRAQELAAQAYGADKCFFSTNGTSMSVHAALLSVACEGEKVIVARTAHRSMISAIVLAGVHPIFLEPEYNSDWDLSHGISPLTLETALKKHPDVKGVFIVSPDYYGVTSDIKGLADICHSHGKPLIVDEAWGPHFPFHPELPSSAISCGADLSMGSLHKTMTALGQASLFLIKGTRISSSRFQKSFYLFETTSPSSLIMGSIDGTRRQMKLNGEKLWGRALELARRARDEISKIPNLRVMGREVLDEVGAFDLDETKIVIDVKDLKISGFEAGDWLWKNSRVALELIDHRRLMALVSVADDKASIERLIESLKKLSQWSRKRNKDTYVELPRENELGTEMAITPTEAYFKTSRAVKLEESVGMICGEMISPYPPGIPRILPGERLTQPIVDFLTMGRNAGMFQEDAADPDLKTILVIE